MAKYILSIDQGTTGTTVSLIHKDGSAVARVNQEFEQIFPQPGWVEHNPAAIWNSVQISLRQALEKASATGHDVAAIGITNQRETALVWDRQTGDPVYNAIVWQCRRTTDFCDRLKKKGLERKIYRKTGLVIDPYFSASKFRWIRDHVPGLKARSGQDQFAAGTIDSFLLWKLTGGQVHATDVSNASRTQLMNLKKCAWDKELLDIFGVPLQWLPEIQNSSGHLGETKNVPGLPDGIPITGIAGDQQAALFGQTCFREGEAKCTYGTGSFILMNIGSQPVLSKKRLLTTVAWRLKGSSNPTFALEGGAFISGAAVQWLRDGLGLIKNSSEIEKLAREVDDCAGVQFIPALSGLGAPYWDPHARGTISGITRGATRAHLARATLEAMALQNVDILEAMAKDLGKKMRHLRVDGGAAANDLLLQMQADFLGVRIQRPRFIETTSAGAAFLAGLGVGFWSNLKEIREVWSVDQEYKASLTAKQRSQRMKRWHQAVAQARYMG